MNASMENRASIIRDGVTRMVPAIDPATRYRYSVLAARWERLRVLIHSGGSTPADDTRFRDLTVILRALSEKHGIPTATEDHAGPDAIVGVTGYDGFLPGDSSYLLSGETWQTAAEGW
jgi:hypothetical protein